MKKILMAILPFMMLCACGGTNKSDEEKDSVKTEETAVSDSAAQDSISNTSDQSINQDQPVQEVKDDKSAEYDELISQYVEAVNKYAKLRTGDNWEAINKASNKYKKLEKQISKIKGNLSSEQLSKFKKAKAKALKWEDYN